MLKNYLFIYLLLPILLISKFGKALESPWSGIQEAKVRLISPLSNTNSSNEIVVGLEYVLKKGWKTYWKSPGAGGFPQEIDYSASQNISDITLKWPTPTKFSILGLKSLGYQDQVVFPIKIRLVDTLKPAEIDLKIQFLICKDICIPGSANIKLLIPFGKKATITKHANVLEKYISLSPIEHTNHLDINIINSILYKNKNDIIFDIEIEKKDPFINPKIYIHNNQGLPVVEPIITFNKVKKKLNAKYLYKDTNINLSNSKVIIHISDLPLVYENSFFLDLSGENINSYFNYNFLTFFIIALLAGLILNIMPCVLPILSIKIVSTLKYLEKDSSLVRKGFIINSFGIIVSYLILGFILVIIKNSGQGISWGMQFQQPYYLMIISIILLFFSLNLFGLFDISLPNFINKLSLKSKNDNWYVSDFFNGFFATVMATPCSAPFVGTAITFAFTQESSILLLIFGFMGLGMALPYISIALFPSIIKIFPKPGQWTIWVRYFMAVLLFLTLIWITNILSNHFNFSFIVISIVVALLIVILLFIINKNLLSKKTSFTIIFFISLTYLLLPIILDEKKIKIITNSNWVEFNTTNLNNLIDDNKIVFVDITADWCVTCQYNKQNVVYKNEIQELFDKYNVIQMQGDWSLPNENIRKFLDNYNRFGIPFNILYGPNVKNGIILSELLSKKELKDAINNVVQE